MKPARAAPVYFSRPGALQRAGDSAAPARSDDRRTRSLVAKLERERVTLLTDLAEAIDGWEGGAPQEELRRVAAMRRRWGIVDPAAARTTDDT